MKEHKWMTLEILNVLMNTDNYLTTKQIVDRVGCDKKTVYNAMDILEVHGFHVDVIKINRYCAYKYLGLYGIGGDA